MRIAVVLPLYNHAATLPLSIHSILSQTRQPDQIVIVNDGSTDGGGELADDLAARHPSIQVIHHETNRGVVAALNTGLNAIDSEYVLFSAADDALLPEMISRAAMELHKYPRAGLFCSEVALVSAELNVIGFRPSLLPTCRRRYIDPAEARRLLRKTDNWIFGSSAIYRRSYLVDVGGFDEDLGSMCDGLVSRYLALQHGFVFAPEVLAIWRVEQTSVSHARAHDRSQLNETICIATEWIERRADYFPAGYADLFARRYRFASERIRLSASSKHPIEIFARLAPLFLKLRPSSVIQLVFNAIRLRWLVGRRHEVEAILAVYAREARCSTRDIETRS